MIGKRRKTIGIMLKFKNGMVRLQPMDADVTNKGNAVLVRHIVVVIVDKYTEFELSGYTKKGRRPIYKEV